MAASAGLGLGSLLNEDGDADDDLEEAQEVGGG